MSESYLRNDRIWTNLPSTAGRPVGTPHSLPVRGSNVGRIALIRFLDGKQRGKTTTVDDAVIRSEGRYRFKKREFARTGGRVYYLKALPKKRWTDKKVPEWTAALEDDRAD